MFSEEVDEIWHEALMFSRDYEKLCHMFTGSMIHHVPHTSEVENVSCSTLKRTQFFLCYNAMFPIEKTSISKIIWGMQTTEKLDRRWLGWFLQQTTETVIKECIRPQAIEIFGQELIERLVAAMFAKAEQLSGLKPKQHSLQSRKQSIRNNRPVVPQTSLKANESQQSTSSDMYWINSAIIAASFSNDNGATNDPSDKNQSSTSSHSCSSGASCGSSCSSSGSSSCSSSSCSSSSCSSC
ncbi:hypothetical protein AM501_09840 [Aneurinibacillus migulanus]|uniref:hypothetical protein n=1 Tax=Aneurinibacillus migulanus TaxID=47500 RepID=UPI0005B7D3EE|nr:hypothetical protein [Aneurinibacillus migulanus]KIV56446.1 hypothetical protein TS64_09255 [Aneurinibacillus migulanus]KPD08454.1 hypothetical protein AM501_09840 [Aneurinibacillus migulanus]